MTDDRELSQEARKLAEQILTESREELTRADGKASLLLAAIAIGVSAIAGAILQGAWSPYSLQSPWEAVWWGGVVAAGGALVAFALAIWPKLKHKSGGGVTYFGDVVRLKTVDALRRELANSAADPAERSVTQLHVIARRVKRKYRWIQTGLWALAIATVCAVASVLIPHFN
jgi:MFS family permease